MIALFTELSDRIAVPYFFTTTSFRNKGFATSLCSWSAMLIALVGSPVTRLKIRNVLMSVT
jgi:hypothetical protein